MATVDRRQAQDKLLLEKKLKERGSKLPKLFLELRKPGRTESLPAQQKG
jgi:hypothetical protein